MTANTCMSLTNYSCICKKTSLRFRESKPWKTIKIIKSRKIHVTSFSSIFCWIVLYSSNWAHLDSWEARLSNSYSVISQVWMIFIKLILLLKKSQAYATKTNFQTYIKPLKWQPSFLNHRQILTSYDRQLNYGTDRWRN